MLPEVNRPRFIGSPSRCLMTGLAWAAANAILEASELAMVRITRTIPEIARIPITTKPRFQCLLSNGCFSGISAGLDIGCKASKAGSSGRGRRNHAPTAAIGRVRIRAHGSNRTITMPVRANAPKKIRNTEYARATFFTLGFSGLKKPQLGISFVGLRYSHLPNRTKASPTTTKTKVGTITGAFYDKFSISQEQNRPASERPPLANPALYRLTEAFFPFPALLPFLSKRSNTAATIKGSPTVASTNTSPNLPPSAGGTNLPHEIASL